MPYRMIKASMEAYLSKLEVTFSLKDTESTYVDLRLPSEERAMNDIK